MVDMKKPKRLVHPSHARTVTSPGDAARLVQQGWLEFDQAHPVSASAVWQRRYRQRCKELGLKRFTAYLPLRTFDELMAMKKPGETTADLLVRLLHSSGDKS